jgi:hypothetical protein
MAKKKDEDEQQGGGAITDGAGEEGAPGPITDTRSGEEVQKADLLYTIDGAFAHLRDMILAGTHAGKEQADALRKVYECKEIVDTVLK